MLKTGQEIFSKFFSFRIIAFHLLKILYVLCMFYVYFKGQVHHRHHYYNVKMMNAGDATADREASDGVQWVEEKLHQAGYDKQ